MIATAAGVELLVVTNPVDFRRGADSLVALMHAQLQHDSVLENDLHLPIETGGPFENRDLGRIRAGAIVETAGARRVPVAADQRRRDAADRIATRRAR